MRNARVVDSTKNRTSNLVVASRLKIIFWDTLKKEKFKSMQ